MATAVSNPVIVSADPFVFNTGSELRISVPVTNIGNAEAANVFLTAITLGNATRVSPRFFPVFIASLSKGSTGHVNAVFSAAGLMAGQKVLLTIRGAYGPGSSLGFAISRYVTIPAAAPFPIILLKATVDVTLQSGTWSYTISNREAPDSNLFINVFSLDIVAPAVVTKSPPGWEPLTDGVSYVGWITTDSALPYPHHLAPGASLGGFEIQGSTRRSESTPYVLTSWNHATDKAGPVAIDVIPSPARLA